MGNGCIKSGKRKSRNKDGSSIFELLCNIRTVGGRVQGDHEKLEKNVAKKRGEEGKDDPRGVG